MDSIAERQYSLSASEVEAFRRDGFLIARRLASRQTCEALLAVAREQLEQGVQPLEYEADLGYPGAPASREAEGGRTVRRLLQAYSRDPLFRQWATSPPLSGRLMQLLGARVMLVPAHHNCVMTKHPRFGSLTGWHQDIRYWSFERPELVSVWLALGEEHEANGCLWVVPGSHALQLPRSRFDDALFLRENLAENRALIAGRTPVELQAGDVLFFHCRLLHCAGRNETEQVKFSVVFTYRTAGNLPLSGTRSASLPSIPVG
ncbi:MAG TPA: phytanoyl-CoA dioxygenase family protein [Burkholderiales bacterium]|jgi:phytanoyl-CoA hydroxylase|nr:phytanoyl-CoA dioxygenase family protein [Burkholderiales bacterium]